MKLNSKQWDQLFKLSHNLSELSESYQLSYTAFINFFKSKKKLTTQDVIIGANCSYGWMPTILDIYSKNLEEETEILNKLKLSLIHI